jgi:hypothetical protein
MPATNPGTSKALWLRLTATLLVTAGWTALLCSARELRIDGLRAGFASLSASALALAFGVVAVQFISQASR